MLRARPGEDVLLQCQGPRDSPITLLEWIRPDLRAHGHVFFYRNNQLYKNYQLPLFRGRVELRDKSMKDGDVAVILRNVNVKDTGTYVCRIITNRMELNGRTQTVVMSVINLSVSYPGNNAGGHMVRGNQGLGLIVGLIVGVLIVVGIASSFCVNLLKAKRRTQRTSRRSSGEMSCDGEDSQVV
ncbi:V-set domain-containing T-cell activation inhibitor 1 [Lates calcarifer]|uniref:V-set domain-containing T-cell activation inhibitor 1 n=1 Tax=Lates calcarifer TaxID=8187 RepID=A0AAJ8DRE0_LATCA|nr:V-set domain-containing T-cell activation inhibitor 1 [Lates calcarifer]